MDVTPITADLARSMMPARPEDAHKGTFGHAVIIGGSRRYPGAPRLAALGALRSGVGLVSLAVPTCVREAAAASVMEAIIMELPESSGGGLRESAVGPAVTYCKDKQACVVGPGLGMQWDTREFVIGFLNGDHPPALVDADGLNAAAEHNAGDALRGTVITPHPGEAARLLDISTKDVQADRIAAAAQCATRFECVAVLKGKETLIASPEGNVFVNPTGNAGMATGGTGDVLAGVIGGLIAQGQALDCAATLGVFIHGLAGDLAIEQRGQRGLIARDVIETLPLAWQALEPR